LRVDVAQIWSHCCVQLFFKAAVAHSHDGDITGNACGAVAATLVLPLSSV
jgi:hypothetical protein